MTNKLEIIESNQGQPKIKHARALSFQQNNYSSRLLDNCAKLKKKIMRKGELFLLLMHNLSS